MIALALLPLLLPAHEAGIIRLLDYVPPLAAPSSDLDDATRTAVIEATLAALKENYVFPEKAEKMDAEVRARVAKGEYASITNPAVLAGKLTNDLRGICKDLHLSVTYQTDPIPERVDTEPSPEMQARQLAESRWNNFGFERVERLPGNIGYLELLGFSYGDEAFETASAAMSFLANTDALIIDLRHNGGGTPAMVAYLTSYLFGPEPVHLNDLEQPRTKSSHQWWTLPSVPGKRFGPDKPVYVLTSGGTFSAAEEFTYNLKCLARATIVGATTGGGAHPVDFVRLGEHFGMSLPVSRAVNPITHTNWEGTGVEPDVQVSASQALTAAQVEALTRLLEGTSLPERRTHLEELRADLERELGG
jgi:hypothetical protein